jgi:hypothetical protein
MKNAARADVVKLIEFGRTLPSCNNMGTLCATLLAAAAEIASHYEPDPDKTAAEFTRSIFIVYENKMIAGVKQDPSS